MPSYKLKTPDGRTVRIRSERPLTKREAVGAYLKQQNAPDVVPESREEIIRRYDAMNVKPGEWLGSILPNIGRGAVRSLEDGALGLASILPEDFETPTRDFIKDVGEDWSPNVEPGTEGSFFNTVTEGIGSTAPYIGAGLMGGAARAAGLGLATSGGVGDASERAREAGASVDERNAALLGGAFAGATQMAPIPVITRFLDANSARGAIASISRIGAAAGAEAAQEAAYEIAQNAVANSAYDADVNPLQGSGEAAGAGGAVGALFRALIEVASPGRSRGGSPEATELDETSSQPEALEQGQMDLFDDDAAPTPVQRGQMDLFDEDLRAAMDEVVGTEEEVTTSESQLDLFEENAEQLDLVDAVDRMLAEEDRANRRMPMVVEQPDVDPAFVEAARQREQAAVEAARAEEEQRRIDTINQQRREQEAAAFPEEEPADPVTAEIANLMRLMDTDRAEREQAEEAQRQATTPDGQQDLFPVERVQAEMTPVAQRATEPQQGELPLGEPEQPAEQTQLEMFGPRGGIVRNRKTTPPAPQVRPEPRQATAPVTPELLERMNVDPGAVPDVVGLDLDNNEEFAIARDRLTEYANRDPNDAVTPGSVRNFFNLVDQKRQGSLVGPKGGVTKAAFVPKSERRDVEGSPQPVQNGAAEAESTGAGASPESGARSDVERRRPPASESARKPKTPKRDNVAGSRDDTPSAGKRKGQQSDSLKKEKLASSDSLERLKEKGVGSEAAPQKESRPKPKRRQQKPKATKPQPQRKQDDNKLASSLVGNKAVKTAKQVSSKGKVQPVNAAKQYFSNFDGDMTGAIRAIAADIAMPDIASQKNPAKGTALEGKFEGTSAKNAKLAESWIRANMSEKTIKRLDDEIAEQKKIPSVKDYEKEINKAEKERKKAEELARIAWSTQKDDTDPTTKLAKLDRKEMREFEKAMDNLANELEDAGLDIDTDEDILYLNEERVTPLAMPSHPDVVGRIIRGDLAGALKTLAEIEGGELGRIANKLAENVGDTRVMFDGDLEGIAGQYVPSSNTIRLARGMSLSNHTLMHEAAHAATQAVIRNKAHPLTKKLYKLFEEIKPQLADVYAGQNVDELVAEYFGNPSFRATLQSAYPKSGDLTLLQRVTDAIKDALRRLLGFTGKVRNQEELNNLMEGLLAPSIMNPAKAPMNLTAEGLWKAFDEKTYELAKRNKTARPVVDFIQAFADKAGANTANLALGALPLGSFVDVTKRYYKGIGEKFQKVINEYTQEVRDNIEALHEGEIKRFGNWFKGAGDTQQTAMKSLLLQGSLYQIDMRKSKGQYEAAQKQAQSDYAQSRTKQNYENLNHLNDVVKNYEEVKGYYDQLNPAGQQQYRQIRAVYDTMYKKLIEQLRNDIVDSTGNQELANSIVGTFMDRLTKGEGMDGYFPFSRKGDYLLRYSFIDESGTEVEAFEMFESPLDRREAVEALREIESDSRAKDTVVQGSIKTGTKLDEIRVEQSVPYSFVGKVINEVESKLKGDPESEQIIRQVMEAAIDMSPQNSILRRIGPRKGTFGYRTDVLNIFGESTTDLVRRTAGIKMRKKVSDLNAELEPMLQNTEGFKKQVGQELQKRFELARSPKGNKVANWLKTAAYGWTLGFNMSSALIDMSAIPMVIYPQLKGEHSGQDVEAQIFKAIRLFSGTPKNYTVESYLGRNLTEQELADFEAEATTEDRNETFLKMGIFKSIANLDFESGDLDADQKRLKTLVDVMREQGQIHRFSLYEDGEMVDETSAMTKFNSMSGAMMQASERMRREVTLIAKYNLELEKLMKEAGASKSTEAMRREAAESAVNLSQLTNGAMSVMSNSRFNQMPIASVMFMYKSYGARMLYLQAKMLNDARKAADGDPEKLAQVKQARAQWGWTMAMSAAFAGARGMPLMGLVAMFYNMFIADDEDDTFDVMMRKNLGTLGTEGLVNTITGANVAQRISLTDMMFRSDPGRSEMTPAEIAWTTLGGPAAGTLDKLYRAGEQINRGNISRGIEYSLPAAVANPFKAIRYATEGARTTRGDIISDDIGPGTAFAQAIGFAPAEITRKQQAITFQKARERKLNTRRGNLLDQLWMARSSGDMQEYMELRNYIIQEYNNEVPEPYRINDSTIKKSESNRRTAAMKKVLGMTAKDPVQWRRDLAEMGIEE